MKKSTILIIDDHTLIREIWKLTINSHEQFEVVADAGDAEQGIELALLHRPDIVTLDINLPSMNGMDAVKEIRRVSPCSKILGVSLHTQPVYAKKMLKNGAMGYVTKNSSREEMFKAIHELLAGKKYICDAIKNSLVEDFTTENQQSKAINQLTERELEIISYIREGKSSKEIAEKLYISVKTVEVHRYKILQKLDLKNAAALVNFINQHQVAFA